MSAALAESVAVAAAFASTGYVLPSMLARAEKDMNEQLPFLGAMAGLGLGIWWAEPETVEALLNPWDLTLTQFCYAYLGTFVTNFLAERTGAACVDKFSRGLLQFRVINNEGKNTEPPFTLLDLVFLLVNQTFETSFVCHLWYFMWHKAAWGLSGVTVLNVLPALWVMLFVNDLIYAPYHYLLHHPALYPLIHKHHHKTTLPGRLALDAIDYNPIELLGGVACVALSYHVTYWTVGIHSVTIALFFVFFFLMQVASHSKYDIQLNIAGLRFHSGNHEMHHRIPTCNMSLYFMTVDKYVTNTFRAYSAEI